MTSSGLDPLEIVFEENGLYLEVARFHELESKHNVGWMWGGNFSLKVQDKQRLGSVKVSILFGIFQVKMYVINA